jgi:hypothetical protein
MSEEPLTTNSPEVRLLYAFPDPFSSPGTEDMIRKARKAGVPVTVFKE